MTDLVLVIDDDERSRKLARDIVASLGYAALEAASAEAGIELARARHPVLVLMDIRLPGMNGIEALQQIRSEGTDPPIPVVAVTASAMPGERDRLLASGFDAYLAKPYHYRDLATAIKDLLGRGRSD